MDAFVRRIADPVLCCGISYRSLGDVMTDLNALIERLEAGAIKALSIKQPYPHHIFYDGKDVENRDWPTRGRGWFIVHAGVSKSELDMDDPSEAAMPRGGVVGMARIVDCVQSMESRWFFGKYGFVLRDAFPLPLIPCRGQLGFFKPPPEVISEIIAALSARTRTATGKSGAEDHSIQKAGIDTEQSVTKPSPATGGDA